MRLVQQAFIPALREAPRDATLLSHQLLARAGFIRQTGAGLYALLPACMRVLERVNRIVREELDTIGCQELSLPMLTHTQLWKTSGRMAPSVGSDGSEGDEDASKHAQHQPHDTAASEYFLLRDRTNSEFLLAPTHEEEITSLVAHTVQSHRQLPLRLYQIGSKFRDELRPRGGLLRGREFVMKDLYTFDTCHETAQETYDLVSQAYTRIFRRFGMRTAMVHADTGNIGGSLSHEFHMIAAAGEDTLLQCAQCGGAANVERKEALATSCTKGTGGEGCDVETHRGIEVGHSFLLGEKYSQVLGASFVDAEGRKRPAYMGCYGLGMTRIIAATVEASHDEDGIIWPRSMAPYQVCILVLSGRRGTGASDALDRAESCFKALEGSGLVGEVVVDTRDASYGYKLKEALLIGYPFIVTVGTHTQGDQLEVLIRQTKDTTTMTTQELATMATAL